MSTKKNQLDDEKYATKHLASNAAPTLAVLITQRLPPAVGIVL